MRITETVKPDSRAAWRAWLAEHHDVKREIWLLLDQRLEVAGVEYLDAVEEALCYGWIDGIQKRRNEAEKAQRFTPRKARSHWTELNKARARRLIALGLMTDSGLAVLPDLSAPFVVPDYVYQALACVPEALEHFEQQPALYQRVRVSYIDEMRNKPDERQKRLGNFVKQTAAGKLFGNWNDGGRLSGF